MPPAARITDHHTCPKNEPGPVPHVGGPTSSGEKTVLIGHQPAARVGDTLVCVPAIDVVAKGEKTVLIGHQEAARIGDPTEHGGKIVQGCPTVLIGSQSYCLKSAAENAAPFVTSAE
jgi:uncharacterized Zn-binding protein involved in type VI secretion